MDLMEYIKIAALVALVMFIVLSIVAMTSFKSIIDIVKDAVKSLDNFKKDFNDNLSGVTDNISDLKEKVIGSLENFDKTSQLIANKTDDLSDLKDKVIDSLEQFDKLSNSLTRNSNDISELKNKFITSLDNVDNLSKQIVSTTKNIEDNANTVIDSIKPVTGMVKSVSDKIAQPVNFTGSLISASSKALKTFVNFVSRSDGKPFKKEDIIFDDEVENNVDNGLKTESDEITLEPMNFKGSPDLYHTSNYLEDETERKAKAGFDDSTRASDSFNVIENNEPRSKNERKQAFTIIDNASDELEVILGDAEKEINEDENMSDAEKEEIKKKIDSLREDARNSVDSFRDKIS